MIHNRVEDTVGFAVPSEACFGCACVVFVTCSGELLHSRRLRSAHAHVEERDGRRAVFVALAVDSDPVLCIAVRGVDRGGDRHGSVYCLFLLLRVRDWAARDA